MTKYLLISLVMIILCLLLTGCWSYREIDSLYIIAGIAIDKEPNSDIYNVTAEFVDAKNTAGGGAQQQTEQGLQSVLLETKGFSVFDAIRKMIKISAKRPYLAHATTIVISEEAAREGIVPFLDLVVTHEEPRLDVDVYVARGKLAGEILHTKSFSSDIRSFELSQIVNENKQLVRIPILKAYEIINQLATPKFSIVLPVVTSFINHGESTNILSGGAVFKTDKLVGFLEQEDIIPYLFIKDQIQSAVLNVETKEGNLNSTITLETLNNRTKIKPVYSDEGISFDIKIKTDVFFIESDTLTNFISPQGRKKLKELTERHLKKRIENHIRKTKEDLEFDIFGFGNIIRQRNPKLWKELEKDWDSIFMDANFNVKCDIRIKNSGHTLGPIKVAD
jgi:spore germination protein KC